MGRGDYNLWGESGASNEIMKAFLLEGMNRNFVTWVANLRRDVIKPRLSDGYHTETKKGHE